MLTIALFLFHLLLYPVLLIGLLVGSAHLYQHLANSPHLGLNTAAKAGLATGVLVVLVLAALALGRPDFISLGGIVVLVVWVGVLGIGACSLVSKREVITSWLQSKFGNGCGCP